MSLCPALCRPGRLWCNTDDTVSIGTAATRRREITYHSMWPAVLAKRAWIFVRQVVPYLHRYTASEAAEPTHTSGSTDQEYRNKTIQAVELLLRQPFRARRSKRGVQQTAFRSRCAEDPALSQCILYREMNQGYRVRGLGRDSIYAIDTGGLYIWHQQLRMHAQCCT